MKKVAILLLVVTLFMANGCAFRFYKKNPKDKVKIDSLTSELGELRELRANERREFAEIEKELKKKLKGSVGLSMEEKGFVITLANNILFDSGKANIKEDAYPVLDKILNVIHTKATDKNLGIEGHTDNVPIKYSSWKSNRELSTARANNVYHYLVGPGGISPSQLMTIGYGEFRPVAANDNAKNRARNRRVEIVILPRYLRKAIGELEKESQGLVK